MKSSSENGEVFYTLLRKEVEETLGKKINSAGHCLILSEEVFSRTSVNINSNTLRRFFGLVKSAYSPSSTTLDILSQYCGFGSFDEFKRLKNNGEPTTTNEGFYAHSILNYLVSLFRETPVAKQEDKTFAAIVKQTIYFLQRHPTLCDKFQRAIAKTKNGQEFYFEQFVNLDELNGFYGDGLRYYLLEKKTPDAQIFGHAILCLRNWLTENAEGVKRHYEALIKQDLAHSMHPFLCGRYFGTQLLHAEAFGLSMDNIIVEARARHDLIRQQKHNYKSFPYFEYVFSAILLLTGNAQEAYYYMEYSQKNYSNRHSHLEQGLSQTMSLIKALILFKNGKKNEAEKLCKLTQPSKFFFLTRKTNMSIYLYLSQCLEKNTEKTDQQLRELVGKLGFTRLNRILVDC